MSQPRVVEDIDQQHSTMKDFIISKKLGMLYWFLIIKVLGLSRMCSALREYQTALSMPLKK